MKSRREFIKTSIRLMALTGLISGTAYIIKRNGTSNNCSQSGLCAGCSKLKGCLDNKAKDFKKNLQINDNNGR